MSKKPSLRTPMSQENATQVGKLAKKLGYKSSAELVRALLRQACVENDIEWDDKLDPVRQWGEHNRSSL
jgi:hypothetical protein